MIFRIKKLNDLELEISFYFLIIMSLIIISNQNNINLYFILSIVIHELGHLFVILYYKIKINKISFKIYGINIELANKNYQANSIDILILLSGSLANFIFALILYLAHQNAILIIINIVIGIFNLLPVESLDGGKILNIILFSCFPMKIAYNISNIISLIFISIFSTINFLFIIHGNFNLSLTILCIILILKMIQDFIF